MYPKAAQGSSGQKGPARTAPSRLILHSLALRLLRIAPKGAIMSMEGPSRPSIWFWQAQPCSQEAPRFKGGL